CDAVCDQLVVGHDAIHVSGMGLMGERSLRSPYNAAKLIYPLRDAIGRVGMVNMEDAWIVQ
ncbi:MAG: hypothetical protein KBF81_03050, partial [Aquabacterium sp.]|nr:hypothetical protein [Aquabacterium sp.]